MHELVDPVLGAASRQLVADSRPLSKNGFNLNPQCNGTSAYDTPECVGIRAATVRLARWGPNVNMGNQDALLDDTVMGKPQDHEDCSYLPTCFVPVIRQ